MKNEVQLPVEVSSAAAVQQEQNANASAECSSVKAKFLKVFRPSKSCNQYNTM
jgi:hypothetical protein